MSKEPTNLIMVTTVNNNKYYNMIPIDDNTWRAEWGRVEGHKSSKVYPMYQWDKMYNAKIKKGYKDVTEFRKVIASSSNTSFKPLASSRIDSFVNTLLSYSHHSIAENYSVTAEGVSPKQVKTAQEILDWLSLYRGTDPGHINEQLIELYHVIPRRMQSVKDHLWDGDKSALNTIIMEEQATLDVMAQQVNQVQTTKGVDKSDTTILEALGLRMEDVQDDEKEVILQLLGQNKHQYRHAYRVTNDVTQDAFDRHVMTCTDKRSQLFWHGSRNENWISILDSGLVLRPTNAVISGKMFGYGLYFADKAQKSIGYSSLRGSYWAGGSDNRGYLGLFYVHTGQPLHIKRHASWCYDLNWDRLRKRGDYDSLYAEGGVDLLNNEYIVYKQEQCTVGFIVEIS